MAAGDGLAYLMSLIGGIGKGGLHGYDLGVEDQQKAANLAEKKREFDEGNFTEITPEMSQSLGVPAGRTRNTIIPALLTAAEKKSAREEGEKIRKSTADAYANAAREMGTRSPLNLQENPEAAGTPATGAERSAVKPEPMLQLLSDIHRAGGTTKDENPVLAAMLRNQGRSSTTSEFFAPHYIQQDDGSFVAVQQPKATGLPAKVSPTGITGPISRSSLNAAITAFQNDPTPENWQRMSVLAGPVAIGPGGNVANRPALSGMQAPPGTPSPVGPQNPIVASVPSQPGNDAVQDIASANSAIKSLEDVAQLLRSGALNNVLGGVAKNFEGAKNRLTETYLGYGQTDEQRAAMAKLGMYFQNVKHELIGATRTVPELKDIQNAVPDEKSLIRGDTAEQMLPKIETMIAKARRDVAARVKALQESNYRAPAPPEPAAPKPAPKPAPAAQEAPWIDLGNGIRIREKR